MERNFFRQVVKLELESGIRIIHIILFSFKRSQEWDYVTEDDKKKIEFKPDDDGEFWYNK